jgi:hypothetical protein
MKAKHIFILIDGSFYTIFTILIVFWLQLSFWEGLILLFFNALQVTCVTQTYGFWKSREKSVLEEMLSTTLSQIINEEVKISEFKMID